MGCQTRHELKHHPCLVPYEDLTETEREYDRITSMKTLKLLIGLGFSIVQLRSGSADNGHEPIGEDSSCDGGAAMAQMDAAIAEGLPVPREAEESLRVAAERYDASPVDTERVVLPKEVEELTEVLAKNAHDEWASQRFSDGWIWGAKRDDELKHHPCLVPYEDLTETEREYDRITAMKTLKLLIGLGFNIERDETSKG